MDSSRRTSAASRGTFRLARPPAGAAPAGQRLPSGDAGQPQPSGDAGQREPSGDPAGRKVRAIVGVLALAVFMSSLDRTVTGST